MPEQFDSKHPSHGLRASARSFEMGGKEDIASVAPPEEVERLYTILIKEGRFAFEDEFRKICPDVEIRWPKADDAHPIYIWRVERGLYLQDEAKRREEEARSQSEGRG